MQKRYGKYLADWRDATGRRRRKAFDTLKEANQHALAMRQLSHPGDAARPNPLAQRPPLRKPLRSGSKRKLTTPTRKRRSLT